MARITYPTGLVEAVQPAEEGIAEAYARRQAAKEAARVARETAPKVEAPVVEEPVKKKTVRRKKLPTPIGDRIYVISKEGGLVLDREANGTCRPAGWVEPDVLLGSISVDKPLESGMLCQNLLYFNRAQITESNIKIKAVYQFDPAVIHLRYKDGKNIKTYELAMPYIQFYCSLNKIAGKNALGLASYITCTKTRVENLSDSVYSLPLNNLSANGNICWGLNYALDVKEVPNIFSMGRQAALTFFNSFFNNHLPPYYTPKELVPVLPNDEKLTFYDVWQRKTQEDPKFILSLPFTKIGTVESILKLCGS